MSGVANEVSDVKADNSIFTSDDSFSRLDTSNVRLDDSFITSDNSIFGIDTSILRLDNSKMAAEVSVPRPECGDLGE